MVLQPLGGSRVVTDSEGLGPSADISATPVKAELARAAGAGTELRELGSRLTMLAVFLLSTAIDLVFLVMWVGLHRAMQPVFRWLGTLNGLDGLTLNVIKIVFTVSTLGVIVTYILKDFLVTVERIWRLR
jgi:hypothetical protein